MKKFIPLGLLVTFAVVSLFSDTTLAQTKPSKDFPNISISNFGKMDDQFYRGARPKEGKGQFVALKGIGVNTVIDLTDNPEAYEKAEAEAAGLRYINIPLSDKDYPKVEEIEQLTKTLNDPEIGVFYVHCAGGRHRTGMAGAIWRFTKYNWNFDQVYAEMKNYDFYTRWGHGEIKDFVKDYAVKIYVVRAEAAKAEAAKAGAAIVTAAAVVD